MENNAFKYQPLDGGDSIRLLVLEPADNTREDLKGSLLHTTVSECGANLLEPYTALSYCWGPPERVRKIYIDGYACGITLSLDQALRDMRHDRMPHRIWADALCIDQANDNEKAHQVGLMGTIYSTASHTIIHLPFSNPRVSQLIKELAVRSTRNQMKEKDLEELRMEILSAPWFTRAWVFQELVLSRDPWVQTGSGACRMRWAQFCDVIGMDHVARVMRLDDMPAQVTSELTPLARINQDPASRLSTSMYELLAARRGICATDPRDLVYANLGIVNDKMACQEFISTDYNMTVERVFTDAAHYIFERAGFDTLIRNVLFDLDPKCPPLTGRFNLPSWVPNWALPAPAEIETVHTVISERSRGARDSIANNQAGLVDGYGLASVARPGVLSFVGFPFDRIHRLLDETDIVPFLDREGFYENSREAFDDVASFLPISQYDAKMEEMKHYMTMACHREQNGLPREAVVKFKRKAYSDLIKLYQTKGMRLATGQNRTLIVATSKACVGDFVVGVCSLISDRRLLVRRWERTPADEPGDWYYRALRNRGFLESYSDLLVPQAEFPRFRKVHFDVDLSDDQWWDDVVNYRSQTQREFGGHGTLIGEVACIFNSTRGCMDEEYRGRMQIVHLH
ncbi:heterokaryon incompatibility protein-domain-containing protein [Echria macrotheca]|uniref:Heterokaryon incompatibility protein-domain-containing protein n=1 Tax=Echria macrotheca TaxID=438768 RepID=A0AAJ0B6P9_9PEZI|nr:heterokaryon incompatibility protein-domain-containing protein [Echria macrotheca]